MSVMHVFYMCILHVHSTFIIDVLIMHGIYHIITMCPLCLVITHESVALEFVMCVFILDL